MIRLLRLEFRKLFQRKLFYILLAVQVLYLIFNELVNFGMYKIDEELLELFGMGGSGTASMLKAVGNSTALIIFSIFITLFACEDRSNDILKNIYSRGYTATQVYFAEYIALCVYTVIFCIASFFTGFAAGSAFFKVGALSGMQVFMLFGQIVLMLAYLSLFFMFAKIIPKTGGVLAVNMLLPVIMSLLFTLIDLAFIKTKIRVSPYSLSGALTTLMGGGNDLLGSLMQPGSSIKWKDVLIAVGVGIFNITVFLPVGMVINRKRSV